jgi:hypothetical protein
VKETNKVRFWSQTWGESKKLMIREINDTIADVGPTSEDVPWLLIAL